MAELVRINVLDIREDGGYSLKYRAFGSRLCHYNEDYPGRYRRVYSRTVPPDVHFLEKTLLPILLSGREVVHPPFCDTCPPAEQAYLWRTFTDRSWEAYVEGGYRALPLDERASLQGYEGGRVFAHEYLHRPGTVWAAKDVRLALSVGMARAICNGEQVRLVGMPVCQHSLDAGMRMWNVMEYSSQARNVYRVGMGRLMKGEFLFSEGIIVDQIPLEVLERSLVYPVWINSVRPIAELVQRTNPELTVTENYLQHTSALIGSILHTLSVVDTRYEKQKWCLNRITPPLRSLMGRPQRVI